MYDFTLKLKTTGSVFILSNRCCPDKPQEAEKEIVW